MTKLFVEKWVKITVKPERITSFNVHLSNSVDISGRILGFKY